jgi:hypothetical protein
MSNSLLEERKEATHSHETGASQQGSEPGNMGAEGSIVLGVLPGNKRRRRLGAAV